MLGVVTVLKSCIGEDYFWNDEELDTNSWQIDKYFSLQELISHPKTTSDCWRWTIFTENIHLSMSWPRPLGCSSPWIFKIRHQVHFLCSSWLNFLTVYFRLFYNLYWTISIYILFANNNTTTYTLRVPAPFQAETNIKWSQITFSLFSPSGLRLMISLNFKTFTFNLATGFKITKKVWYDYITTWNKLVNIVK